MEPETVAKQGISGPINNGRQLKRSFHAFIFRVSSFVQMITIPTLETRRWPSLSWPLQSLELDIVRGGVHEV
jgi:hypothetical protein